MRYALTFLVGLGLGIGGMALLAPRSSTPVASVPAPSASAPPVAIAAPEQTRCDPDRTAQLALENAVLVAQLTQAGLQRVEWPADPPAALRPEAVRALIDAMVPELPVGETLTVDCDEFPCVAFFRMAEGTETSTGVMNPLAQAFHDRTGGLGASHLSGTGTADGSFYVGVSFGPVDPTHDSAVTRRLDARMKELADTFVPR